MKKFTKKEVETELREFGVIMTTEKILDIDNEPFRGTIATENFIVYSAITVTKEHIARRYTRYSDGSIYIDNFGSEKFSKLIREVPPVK